MWIESRLHRTGRESASLGKTIPRRLPLPELDCSAMLLRVLSGRSWFTLSHTDYGESSRLGNVYAMPLCHSSTFPRSSIIDSLTD